MAVDVEEHALGGEDLQPVGHLRIRPAAGERRNELLLHAGRRSLESDIAVYAVAERGRHADIHAYLASADKPWQGFRHIGHRPGGETAADLRTRGEPAVRVESSHGPRKLLLELVLVKITGQDQHSVIHLRELRREIPLRPLRQVVMQILHALAVSIKVVRTHYAVHQRIDIARRQCAHINAQSFRLAVIFEFSGIRDPVAGNGQQSAHQQRELVLRGHAVYAHVRKSGLHVHRDAVRGQNRHEIAPSHAGYGAQPEHVLHEGTLAGMKIRHIG